MKRTRINPRGKRSQETSKSMDADTPYLCDRAGGTWMGWKAPVKCVGAQCEWCGKFGDDHARAHIMGRGRQGKDDRTNLAILCQECHDLLDNEKVDGMREELLRIVKSKNEQMGVMK